MNFNYSNLVIEDKSDQEREVIANFLEKSDLPKSSPENSQNNTNTILLELNQKIKENENLKNQLFLSEQSQKQLLQKNQELKILISQSETQRLALLDKLEKNDPKEYESTEKCSNLQQSHQQYINSQLEEQLQMTSKQLQSTSDQLAVKSAQLKNSENELQTLKTLNIELELEKKRFNEESVKFMKDRGFMENEIDRLQNKIDLLLDDQKKLFDTLNSQKDNIQKVKMTEKEAKKISFGSEKDLVRLDLDSEKFIENDPKLDLGSFSEVSINNSQESIQLVISTGYFAKEGKRAF